HIRLLSIEEFTKRIIPYLQAEHVITENPTERDLDILRQAAPLIQERITVLSEAVPMLWFLFCEAKDVVIEPDAKAGIPENSKEIILASIEVLADIAEADWSTERIQTELNQKLIEQMEQKPRNAFGPLRTGISGRRVSPPLFESMEILGKDETLNRLRLFATHV
ncbi:MAG: glutamate--tRNA ligase, partial [Microbacteriaceae bacterium]|nr:glutamate--tRNA ligase [Microbacteriaceae bacterium]